MACCFSGDPLEGNEKEQRPNTFIVPMKEACTMAPGLCLYGCLCVPCAAYKTRITALHGHWERYMCCQGYLANPLCPAGCCQESKCPMLCLCIESTLCCGPAVSSTRSYVMDEYHLRPDPCAPTPATTSWCALAIACRLPVI